MSDLVKIPQVVLYLPDGSTITLDAAKIAKIETGNASFVYPVLVSGGGSSGGGGGGHDLSNIFIDEAGSFDNKIFEEITAGVDVGKGGDSTIFAWSTPTANTSSLTPEILEKAFKQIEEELDSPLYSSEFNFYDIDPPAKKIYQKAENETYVGDNLMNAYSWFCAGCTKKATILGFFLTSLEYHQPHSYGASMSGVKVMMTAKAEYTGQVRVFPSCNDCVDSIIPEAAIKAPLTKELIKKLQQQANIKVEVEEDKPRSIKLDG